MPIFDKFYKRKSGIDTFFKRGTVVKKDGLTVAKVAVATFDSAANDSDGVSNKTAAAHGLGVYLPDNAIVMRSWIDVVTTFTSATSDAASIALMAQSANDLSSALTIVDGRNMFDAGMHQCIPGSWNVTGSAVAEVAMAALIAGSWVKMTAERELTATIAIEAITAGKLVLYVEYVLSD